ncbi:MAG: tetraacyldisaccharide 4'-kinase [Acidobacteria bacterium]|nr:tetraacyldisaccharide 4'-kinase [Acidobacteriota bacterium]
MRNLLYDRGILRSRALAGPVVSIGNLSVGGTGKTPFVIHLGELLVERGIPFDVLSRGYGRRSRGVLAVRPDGAAREFGDEPLLIARRLRCPVVVGESRYEAGRFAERAFGPRLHLLDDGFQHRSLARDFDIVLVTPEDTRDGLLPAGRLREPLASLERADAVVLTDEADLGRLPPTIKTVWHMRRSLSVSEPPGRPLVFCGIGQPGQFLAQLEAAGIEATATKLYRDHHAYGKHDIRELDRLGRLHHADGFITTEKDAINFGPALAALGRVAVARAVVELRQPDDAVNTILRALKERRPLHETIPVDGGPDDDARINQ